MNVSTRTVSPASTREQKFEPLIRKLLFRANTAMDNESYDDFLDCCATDFSYKITTYSPEIRRDMIWFEQDKDGMAHILGTINKHNRDRTPLVRHWTMQDVTATSTIDNYHVTSTFEIYRTELDGGITNLYAVGRYLDEVNCNDDIVLFRAREVRLNTRMLGTGYHIPF